MCRHRRLLAGGRPPLPSGFARRRDHRVHQHDARVGTRAATIGAVKAPIDWPTSTSGPARRPPPPHDVGVLGQSGGIVGGRQFDRDACPAAASKGATRCQYHAAPPAPGISAKVASEVSSAAFRPLRAHLGESVGQPTHANHQRRRRADFAVQIDREIVGGTPIREANSCALRPDRLKQQRIWRAASARSLASRCCTTAHDHLGKRLRHPDRVGVREHLFDLAGGTTEGITLDGHHDALPHGDIPGLQCGADRGCRPELHRADRRTRSIGRAGARRWAAHCPSRSRSTSPRLLQHCHGHCQATLSDFAQSVRPSGPGNSLSTSRAADRRGAGPVGSPPIVAQMSPRVIPVDTRQHHPCGLGFQRRRRGRRTRRSPGCCCGTRSDNPGAAAFPRRSGSATDRRSEAGRWWSPPDAPPRELSAVSVQFQRVQRHRSRPRHIVTGWTGRVVPLAPRAAPFPVPFRVPTAGAVRSAPFHADHRRRP